MAVGEPNRVRTVVRSHEAHVGYLTVVTYPDRDLLWFAAGSPYSEVVVSDLHGRHVALLQELKECWLVHCGSEQVTTTAAGRLTDVQKAEMAVFALSRRNDPPAVFAEAIAGEMNRVLG